METIEFLPLVKAYPALSKTYGEVSCIAGVQITPAGPRWIRLYPVPFRALDDRQQFRKYQRIRVAVERHRRDQRPETRRPDRDSIELLGDPIPTRDDWAMRRRFVEPLMAESMCEIQRRQGEHRTSLGVFRPSRVLGLDIRPADVRASKADIARAWAAQGSLLDTVGEDERDSQLRALELIPWTFRLRYECSDPGCRSHVQSVIDWEIAQYFRRVRNVANWQDKIQRKLLDEVCGSDRDTALFVGNQHQHPTSFLILGFWWPRRRPEQMRMPIEVS